MLLGLLLLGIFIGCVAMLWNEGMWSNAVTLINVTLAALIATNYFEPLAARVDRMMPTYTYMWDFLMLWGLFAVVYIIMRAVTDTISRQRVRFKMPVEHTGRILFAVWVAWIMVGFSTMSLHLAPLGPNSFRGAFGKKPTSGNFLGMAPDRQWLAFVQKCSRGTLSRSHRYGEVPGYHPHPADQEKGRRVFDPQGDLIVKYRNRRAAYDEGRIESEATGMLQLQVKRD
jgi:hypothetical protein